MRKIPAGSIRRGNRGVSDFAKGERTEEGGGRGGGVMSSDAGHLGGICPFMAVATVRR